MFNKNSFLKLIFLVLLMVNCLGSNPGAGLAEASSLEEVELELSKSPDNWFLMSPLSETWDVYGLSFLMESSSCRSDLPIYLDVYQASNIGKGEKKIVTLKNMVSKIIYPRDLNKKRFYSVFFKKHKVIEGSRLPQTFPVVPADVFLIKIKTLNKISIFLKNGLSEKLDIRVNHSKKNPGNITKSPANRNLGEVTVYKHPYLYWVTVPMWGRSAGTVLGGAEKPYLFLTPAFYLLLFECIIIVILMSIFFGRNFLSEQEPRHIFSVITITSFIAACLYYATVSTDFLGGDNFDMQKAQFLYKDTHFPGYPIMIFFGYWFGKLMPVGNFFYKANLFATFCSSIGIGFFAGATYRIVQNRIFAVLLSLCLATTQTVWNYSVVAQNYSVLILFQCLLIFAIVHLQLVTNFASFFKFIVFAFLAPIAHMTNTPGVLLIVPVVVVRYWRIHRFNFYKFSRILLCLTAIFIILYSPLFFKKNPTNYPPVFVQDSQGKTIFDRNNVTTFFRYITGDTPGKERRSGIVKVIKENGVVGVFKKSFFRALAVLNYGYGYFFMIIGILGFILFFILKIKSILSWYLFFTIAGNMFLNCCELILYQGLDDYGLTMHQLPMIIALSFAISGIFLFLSRKDKFISNK